MTKNVKPDGTDDTIPCLRLRSAWYPYLRVLLSADRGIVTDLYLDREFTACWVLNALVLIADGVEVELIGIYPFPGLVGLVAEALRRLSFLLKESVGHDVVELGSEGCWLLFAVSEPAGSVFFIGTAL